MYSYSGIGSIERNLVFATFWLEKRERGGGGGGGWGYFRGSSRMSKNNIIFEHIFVVKGSSFRD